MIDMKEKLLYVNSLFTLCLALLIVDIGYKTGIYVNGILNRELSLGLISIGIGFMSVSFFVGDEDG